MEVAVTHSHHWDKIFFNKKNNQNNLKQQKSQESVKRNVDPKGDFYFFLNLLKRYFQVRPLNTFPVVPVIQQ